MNFGSAAHDAVSNEAKYDGQPGRFICNNLRNLAQSRSQSGGPAMTSYR
jgi:hypothetical protein